MSGKWQKDSVKIAAVTELMEKLQQVRSLVELQREDEVKRAITIGETAENLVNYNELSKETAEKVREAVEVLRKARVELTDG